MNYLAPERLEHLARSYALGTLSVRTKRRFARVVAGSGAAARLVATWQERFAVLMPVTEAMQPRPVTWQRVQQRLFPLPPDAVRAGPTLPAGRTGRSTASGNATPRWLGHWLTGLTAGLTLSASVLLWQPRWLGLEPADGQMPASYVGVLQDPQGRSLLVTSVRRHGQALTVRLLRPVTLAVGQRLQLWAWNETDATQPVPVAAWSAPGTVTLPLRGEAEALLGRMTHLGMSVETATSGSAPTKPFIASGPCGKLW